MDYKVIVDKYFDGLGITAKEQDTIAYKKAKYDISDTLNEMFSVSESPKKTVHYNIRETKNITEDFADSTLITGLTASSGFTISGGKASTTSGGTLTISNLNKITDVILDVSSTPTSPPLTIFPTLRFIVTNELSETLYDETTDFTDDAGLEETITQEINVTGVNLTLNIILNKNGQTSEASILNLKLEQDVESIDLPTDFLIPLQVTFTEAETGRLVASSEIHYERFQRWTPNKLFSPDPDVTSQITDLQPIYATTENAEFDRTVGYTFNVESDAVKFYFKPTFTGILTLVYAHFPSYLTLVEGNRAQINDTFIECLVDGAIYRRLKKNLTESIKKAESDAKVTAITISMREFKATYREALQRFIAFTTKRAEAVFVKPFTFLNDFDMLAD
jgi:hypothetical protein